MYTWEIPRGGRQRGNEELFEVLGIQVRYYLNREMGGGKGASQGRAHGF